jgi:predicted nucleic acid-binding Zn ribbon protein
MKTPKGRSCIVCKKPIDHRRADARTCGTNCRSALYRRNLSQRVLVRFQCPLDLYTSLVIQALRAGIGIDSYLTKLVSSCESAMTKTFSKSNAI